jgi:hypothetical protein
MRVCLDDAIYQKLLDRVPRFTRAYLRLQNRIKIERGSNTTNRYLIDCSEQEADVYLQTARTQFPVIVAAIEEAIRTARR